MEEQYYQWKAGARPTLERLLMLPLLLVLMLVLSMALVLSATVVRLTHTRGWTREQSSLGWIGCWSRAGCSQQQQQPQQEQQQQHQRLYQWWGSRTRQKGPLHLLLCSLVHAVVAVVAVAVLVMLWTDTLCRRTTTTSTLVLPRRR